MKDLTKGHHSGDNCPECSNGNLEIRETIKASDNSEKVKYAQCSRCSWNSMR